MLYGQTRILFAMSRDGMIPEFFHKVSPRTQTPIKNTVIVATIVGALAGFLPISFLAEMTSIGTLTAFKFVAIGVMVLRRTHPDLRRGFKVPLYPFTPILAIAGSIWIILDLRAVTIYVFVIWVSIAFVWYFVYSRHTRTWAGPSVGLDKGYSLMTLLIGSAPDQPGEKRPCTWPQYWPARSRGRPGGLLSDCSNFVDSSMAPAWTRRITIRCLDPSGGRKRSRRRAEPLGGWIVAATLFRPRHRAHQLPAGSSPDRRRTRTPRGIVVTVLVGRSASGASCWAASAADSCTARLSVALRPAPFHCRPDARVARVTAAFGGAPTAPRTSSWPPRAWRRWVGASLRIASFAVRSRPPLHCSASDVGGRSGPCRAVASRRSRRPPRGARAESATCRPRRGSSRPSSGTGESWDEALEDIEWGDGDVLVVGSSSRRAGRAGLPRARARPRSSGTPRDRHPTRRPSAAHDTVRRRVDDRGVTRIDESTGVGRPVRQRRRRVRSDRGMHRRPRAGRGLDVERPAQQR